MGFDTWVEVGDRVVVQYRKQTGDLPRFLFSLEDIVITPDPTSAEQTESVAFESTAGKVLAVLAEQGLGWDGTVAAYTSVRSGWAAEAMLTGQYMVQLPRTKDQDAQIEAQLASQRVSTPLLDLVALGSLLASQWTSGGDVLLFNEREYDSPLEVSGSTIAQALDAAERAGTPPLPTARAIETIAFLFREARLVAWPILLTILLKQLPPDTPVRYDLTGGIYEFGMQTPSEADTIVKTYWAETRDVGRGLRAKPRCPFRRTCGLRDPFRGRVLVRPSLVGPEPARNPQHQSKEQHDKRARRCTRTTR